MTPIRVLVVDDSALARALLRRALEEAPDVAVVAVAADAYEARDLLVKHRPDVMTLDLELPRMDGLTFLRRVMAALPTRTLVVSALTPRGSARALEALEAGAIEVVPKPTGDGPAVAAGLAEIVAAVRVAAAARLVRRASGSGPVERSEDPGAPSDRLLALGASTGGVAALGQILPRLPAGGPGAIVVQHMPPGFTRGFAERLDGQCAVRVTEAADGDLLLRGRVLVAPGGVHLLVRRAGAGFRVALEPAKPGDLHAPSVDHFLRSVAVAAGPRAAACLLTGMGRDGAEGLLALRRAGGRTFAQDEATSAVWGMPGAAVALGAAEATLPLDAVAGTLVRALEARRSPSGPLGPTERPAEPPGTLRRPTHPG